MNRAHTVQVVVWFIFLTSLISLRFKLCVVYIDLFYNVYRYILFLIIKLIYFFQRELHERAFIDTYTDGIVVRERGK